MSEYVVKDVVCDTGIYLIDNEGAEELIEICNSKRNAELICEILNADLLKNGTYTIWKDAKIADLEAKLAESKSKLRVSNSSLANSQLEYNKLKKEYDKQEKLLSQILASNSKLQFENNQLKQQLAEKEKEIEEVRSNHANLVADIAYKAVNVYTAESRKTGVPTFYKIHYSQLLEIEDMANLRNYAKDKAEFAIQQLQRVKGFATKEIKECNKLLQEESEDDYYIQSVNARQSICYEIKRELDRIIKELKGENCGYK